MFRVALFLAAILGAAAFSPAARVARSAALKMGFENELGVLPPTGFWDPLGLSKKVDAEGFASYRTAELKHGRVAQLAVIGYIVPEIYKFPGEIAPGITFESIPNGVAAIEAVPSLGWLQIFFLVGAVDYRGILALGTQDTVGVLGNSAVGQDKTPEELAVAQTQELQHGRLAMLAILELLRHDSQNFVTGGQSDLPGHLITGLPFLYN